MTGAGSKRPRILLAEDEQVVALDVTSELVALGYDVVGVASTGPEAVNLVGKTRPDLVLMDIQLCGAMDGIAAADEIRSHWQIPVVFATAFANEETLTRAKAAGPFGYLTKPFRTKELNATLVVALHQHHLTQELSIQHSWLRTVLAGLNQGVIATDINGQVRYLNVVAELLTGWELSEALDRPIEEVYPLQTVEGRPVAQCQIRRVLATGQSIGRERFVFVRGGRQIAVEESASPIRDAQDRIAGAVTVIVDVTEQYRFERERERLLGELKRSNADLARFSYAVSHDLQTPVRTVKTFAELLSRQLDSESSAKTAELLGHITDAADGMHRLIQSLLSYAQVGHGQINREAVSASDVVASIEVMLTPLLAETGGEIKCGPLPVVSADRVQFQQLIQNLVANAIRYRQPGRAPRISISAETTEEEWQFAISDNGEGIPAEQIYHIFEPLNRLHGSDIQGTGIGLAICHAIVERHGGRIWAESPGPGGGATFRFALSRDKRL